MGLQLRPLLLPVASVCHCVALFVCVIHVFKITFELSRQVENHGVNSHQWRL